MQRVTCSRFREAIVNAVMQTPVDPAVAASCSSTRSSRLKAKAFGLKRPATVKGHGNVRIARICGSAQFCCLAIRVRRFAISENARFDSEAISRRIFTNFIERLRIGAVLLAHDSHQLIRDPQEWPFCFGKLTRGNIRKLHGASASRRNALAHDSRTLSR